MILRAVLVAALMAVAPMALAEPTTQGSGAVVRVLDKLSGALTDLELSDGERKTVGRIDIALAQCRYPSGNPAGNAYAYLAITAAGDTQSAPLFDGWMIASSPALSALDHPRYDVWVLRCITS